MYEDSDVTLAPRLTDGGANMRRFALAVVLVLAGHSTAFATWSVIAVDAKTGQVIIASATCVRQAGFPKREPNPARDLMDVLAWTIRAGTRCSSTTS
jgi:hypothetical protein